MFVVRDADTTVYIFGTFHALDGQAQWFDDQVRNAFEQSNELVSKPSSRSGPTLRAHVGAGLSGRPSVTPSASFLATTRMAINAGRSQGMQVGNGADMVLRHVAEAEGKPVDGLETFQSQLDMFNRMPAAPAAPTAPAACTDAADGNQMTSLSKAMADMQSAWKRGDQSGLRAHAGPAQGASPDTYRMMFTERNERWADWIRARMQTPGTVFVAVGAGHLAGRTACSCVSPSAASRRSASTDSANLAFPAVPPLWARASRPWSSLEAWRGHFINRRIAK